MTPKQKETATTSSTPSSTSGPAEPIVSKLRAKCSAATSSTASSSQWEELTNDPFTTQPRTGRIRRVYVRCEWRNQGVGRALVSTLVEAARKSFGAVRLRAENEDAARLYESIGFTPIEDPGATHTLSFEDHTS